MKLNLETQKKIASEWFRYLQLEVCKEFEELERKAAKRKKIKPSTLKKKIWNKKKSKRWRWTVFYFKEWSNI